MCAGFGFICNIGHTETVAEIPFLTVLPISTVTVATDSMISLVCAGSAPRSIKEAMIMSPDAPMSGSKIRQVMEDYVVHNGAGSSPRGLHKSVKKVGIDLLMADSQGLCRMSSRLVCMVQ